MVNKFASDIIARQRAAHAKADANAPQREDLISFCMHGLSFILLKHAHALTRKRMPMPMQALRSISFYMPKQWHMSKMY